MAVSVQTHSYTNLGMWTSGDQQSAFLSTRSDASPDSMTYQYPLGSSDNPAPSNMLPGFHSLPREESRPGSPALARPTSPVSKFRGPPVSSKPSSKIKKSVSTPNVRSHAVTSEAAALAEKRRNKLGYHRTSVACVHCRRRKIRCIPAPADPQNRCSNCIRLKKECNFFPVDQQPQPEVAGPRISKPLGVTGRDSESSSPSASAVPAPELQSNLPYPHLTMPSIQNLGGPQMKRQRTESYSPESKVATASRTFDYNQGHTNWMAPNTSPVVAKSQAEAHQGYWRATPQESPITPAFSPFTPGLHIPPSQNWPASHTEPSPRDESSWPPPQRSSSYSNIEGLHGNQQYSHYSTSNPQHASPDYASKPRMNNSGMYPPPPITTSSGGHSAIDHPAAPIDAVIHPQSAGTLPPAGYAQWQQPYSYSKPQGTNVEPYGSWSNSHGGSHHQEAQPQTTGYGYGEPTTGSYYPAR